MESHSLGYILTFLIPNFFKQLTSIQCCNNRPVLEECHLLFLEDVLFIEPLDNEERIKIPAGKSELPSCVACLGTPCALHSKCTQHRRKTRY